MTGCVHVVGAGIPWCPWYVVLKSGQRWAGSSEVDFRGNRSSQVTALIRATGSRRRS